MSTGAAAVGVGILAAACASHPPPEPRPAEDPPADVGPPALAELTPGELAVLEDELAERRRLLETGELPPVPEVDGPLSIRVQYPRPHQRLTVRDSNFVFGSVGTGWGALWIDGEPVPVEPNGAFLAWLPVPETARGDTAIYRLRARRGTEEVSLRLPVRLPPVPYAGPPGTVWLDTAALRAASDRWALPDEPLSVSVRGAPGLTVWLEAGDDRFPLRPEPTVPGPGVESPLAEPPMPGPELGRRGRTGESPDVTYRGRIPAGELRQAACRGGSGAGSRPTQPSGCGPGPDRTDTLRVALSATDGIDSVRLERRVPLRLLDPGALPVARLVDEPDPVQGRRGVVVARPTPSGPYRWLLPPETRALVDGRRENRFRVRLAPGLHAWVVEEDAELLPPGSAPPESPVEDLRVEPTEDGLSLRVPLRAPIPAEVTQTDERTLVLTLYGALGETSRAAHGPRDPLLKSLRWEQLPGSRYRLELRLREPVWGYRLAWDRGDAGAYQGLRADDVGRPGARDPVLRLDVRRPPEIDLRRPLRNRAIAVDPGHPGAGAFGPTGYYEGDANLAVARRLVEMLRGAGARAILVRTDTLPLGLYERTARARRAGAEIFVSIHNDALPDGIRPFGREGTSTYYHHPQSRELAETVQAGMLEAMGLRDLGVLWGDLAVIRETWMPAVLTEGAFMMVPRHEAALRTPEFQERYARGVLEGLESFLRGRGERARSSPEER